MTIAFFKIGATVNIISYYQLLKQYSLYLLKDIYINIYIYIWIYIWAQRMIRFMYFYGPVKIAGFIITDHFG